jgi:L-fuconolactonase
VLDTHVHVWDTGELRYDLFAGNEDLQRPRFLGDYFDLAEPVGVHRAICVEAASAGADGRREAEWLLWHVGDDERVAGVVAWAPLDDPGLDDHLRWLRELGSRRIVGIRRSFEFEPPDFARRPQLAEGARLAGRYGLAVDLVLFSKSLPAATDLVRACPGTRFVLDHLGKPPIASGEREPWAGDLAELARLPNVTAKLSGLATEAGPDWSAATLAPYVAHAVACFGPERLMLGSDWPIVDAAGGLGRWFTTIRELLSPVPLEALDATAARIYGLRGG